MRLRVSDPDFRLSPTLPKFRAWTAYAPTMRSLAKQNYKQYNEQNEA